MANNIEYFFIFLLDTQKFCLENIYISTLPIFGIFFIVASVASASPIGMSGTHLLMSR